MTRSEPPGSPAFSDSVRSELIDSLSAAVEKMDRIADAYNAAQPDELPALDRDLETASREIGELYKAYEDGLPRPAISRCPFTGSVFRMAIDTFGLDGPWWNHEVPARPVEDVLGTVFAITGAVNFGGPPPNTPFLCKPGPGVPYVVPRMLVSDEVKAVVSTLKVHAYDAYPVIYYAEDTPHDLARINTWGLDHYAAEMPQGEGYALQIPDDWLDFDFDLAVYIETGRLLWIAPEDETLTLRSTAQDCPFLGLEGHQYPIGLFEGESWNCLVNELDPAPAHDRAQ